MGDYLLSKGLLIAVHNDEFEFLKVTSEAVRRMSEGELLQIQKSRQKSIDEETYFKIISDKTASLDLHLLRDRSDRRGGAGRATFSLARVRRADRSGLPDPR